ncbi:Bet v I domain-containing protein, partial [Cynara cardunculus var. scolymus]
SVKHQIDELNEKTFTYKYTLIEGEGISDKIEKVSYDIKFEGSDDGGTISKMTTTIYTLGEFEIKEEELKAGKEKVLGLYKVVEAYLLKNPDAYVSYDIKFEGSANGGTISKMTTTIYTLGDFEIKEEELKAGKEKVLGLYKVVEAYLLKNPDAYA